MKVMILGIDGYIGWALANHLILHDHSIIGIDNGSRRRRVKEVGSQSLIPIETTPYRKSLLKSIGKDKVLDWIDMTLGCHPFSYISAILREYKPDAIYHLAEQPSAPWSMIDVAHAEATQRENVLGTLQLLWAMRQECPEAHLIKIGTMGEYGTPNCDIPEGEIPTDCLIGNQNEIGDGTCPMAGLQFPRSPGSWYHLSKVHDTHNIIFACKTWGLLCTDVMQGVVYGCMSDTRFDYDQYFGTVINRFCVQSLIGYPLTVYGKGGQQRGFLPLQDSITCLTIALENPPNVGEYRVFNQFGVIHSINHLASMIREITNVSVDHIPNPRTETDEHYYNPENRRLIDLGYSPDMDTKRNLEMLIEHLDQFRDRIIEGVIYPTTQWR